MAKRGKAAPEEKKATSEYYKLNLKAVDDLVTADESNSPPVSQRELRKYRSGPKIHLSDWVRSALIKLWFAGAACFFFLWGLGVYVTSQLDQMVILSVALGAITDLLTNNALRFFAQTKEAGDRFLMVTRRGVGGLLLTVLYGMWVMFCVVTTYNVINVILVSLSGARDTVPLGVEPILFGVLVTAWDFLFIKIKRTALQMVRDARAKEGKHG